MLGMKHPMCFHFAGDWNEIYSEVISIYISNISNFLALIRHIQAIAEGTDPNVVFNEMECEKETLQRII